MAKCTKYSQQFKEDAVQYRLPLFDERKKEISEISAHIKTIQTSLDDIIFSIYQIPPAISDMIKENTQFDL